MRFKKLDLNLLAALDALFRTRSVSRAAEELFVTQSAMSNALRRLRDYFNDPLLIQTGRRLELSPLAANLKKPVRDIMVQIEAATVSTAEFEPAAANQRLTLLVSDYSLHTILPPFLAAVARVAPHLTFDLRAQQDLPHLLLERGEADLLIAPHELCSPDHPSEVLFNDELLCVVDAHRTGTGERLTREDFETAGHVVMQPPNGFESFAVKTCREVGLSMREEVRTYSFNSMLRLVEGTRRIALVQGRLTQTPSLIPQVRIVKPPIELPRLAQALQWREHRDRDPLLIWLRQTLRQTLEEQPG